MEQLSDEAIKFLNKNIKKISNKEGFFSKLLDKENDNVSSTNFFIVCVTIIGLVLLFVPIFILVIEAWYNHTITTDLNGMAAYIGAVAMMFGTVGITKAWTSYSDNKRKAAKYKAMADTGSLDVNFDEGSYDTEVHLNEDEC